MPKRNASVNLYMTGVSCCQQIGMVEVYRYLQAPDSFISVDGYTEENRT